MSLSKSQSLLQQVTQITSGVRLKQLRELCVDFLVGYGFALFIGQFCGFGFVKGSSMVPTMLDKEVIFYFKQRSRDAESIRVGDIYSVWSPLAPDQLYIKRILATSREAPWALITGRLSEGTVWIQGDGEVSLDSRSFGPVPSNLIVGRAVATVWPPSRWKFHDRWDPSSPLPYLTQRKSTYPPRPAALQPPAVHSQISTSPTLSPTPSPASTLLLPSNHSDISPPRNDVASSVEDALATCDVSRVPPHPTSPTPAVALAAPREAEPVSTTSSNNPTPIISPNLATSPLPQPTIATASTNVAHHDAGMAQVPPTRPSLTDVYQMQQLHQVQAGDAGSVVTHPPYGGVDSASMYIPGVRSGVGYEDSDYLAAETASGAQHRGP